MNLVMCGSCKQQFNSDISSCPQCCGGGGYEKWKNDAEKFWHTINGMIILAGGAGGDGHMKIMKNMRAEDFINHIYPNGVRLEVKAKNELLGKYVTG